MNQLPALHDLIPLLPELVLACGAMLMLMLGVAIGERSSAVVNGFCFIVLLLAGAALSSVPAGTHTMFEGSFIVDDYARFLKLLTLVGSGGALLIGVSDELERQAPGIGVDLLFVDGEDYGDFTATPGDVLIGSRHYAANQPAGPPPMYAVLFDLVADRELQIFQEGNSLIGAPEVVNLVWDTAKDLGYAGSFVASPRHTLIDDHLELQKVGLRAIDVVDFDYPAWHTPEDTIDKVSPASLQIVGDVAVALIRREGTS
jgi:hypothetical protein